MTAPPPARRLIIQGLTNDGRAFRPSDWDERLAGALACFRPEGVVNRAGAFAGYSPYCMPTMIEGVRCVVVAEALREVELLAWDFALGFARDNDLRTAFGPTASASQDLFEKAEGPAGAGPSVGVARATRLPET